MMEIERKLSTSDLNQFKVAPMEHFVKEVLKYRLWKTEKALEKMNYAPLKRVTAEFYFNNIIRYFNGGNNTLSKPYKELVEKYRVICPLEPETGCKRTSFQTRKSKKSEPIVSEVKKEPLVKSLIQSFIYAVKVGNMLMTFNTQSEAKAFQQGYKFANPVAEISELHIDKSAIEVIQ